MSRQLLGWSELHAAAAVRGRGAAAARGRGHPRHRAAAAHRHAAAGPRLRAAERARGVLRHGPRGHAAAAGGGGGLGAAETRGLQKHLPRHWWHGLRAGLPYHPHQGMFRSLDIVGFENKAVDKKILNEFMA